MICHPDAVNHNAGRQGGATAATRFCIVRHGETDWNAVRRIQGQVDIPLNAKGRAQAGAAARGLAGHRFDALYSSDLCRARETAATLATRLGLPLHDVPGLRERHYGRMQGLTADEARSRHPEVHAAYAARRPDHDLGGGETLNDFAARVAATFGALAESHPGQTLVLVSHGGVLDIVHRMTTGQALTAPRDFKIPNAGFNWIAHAEGRWQLVAWAELAHLAAALDEVAG